ncbi:MAG: class I SAM-dependent methyltransferase [Candidatus Peribacteraceae bacterium]|nr:class I SAM-dependent methyltransferase [Candidatus Peribacteraceae bacterium]
MSSSSPLPFLKGRRTHDRFYLHERRTKPKEYFLFVADKAGPFLRRLPAPAILDVGCAAGDFLSFLAGRFPSARLHGMDILPALIRRARKDVPAATFFVGDIDKGKHLPQAKFDAIFMNGVHLIFDDIDGWMQHVLSLLKPRGCAYVFGIFNPEPVDVLTRTRAVGGEWQPGWNVFSRRTVLETLEKHGVAGRFFPFEIGIDVPRHRDDPLRAWSFKDDRGHRLLVNGTQILHHLSLLVMQRKKEN